MTLRDPAFALLVALAASAAFTAAVHAQRAPAELRGAQETESAQVHSPTRSGLWASAGVGAGSFALTCDDCTGDRRTGLTGALALGMTLTRHLLIGVAANGWWKRESGMDATVAAVSGLIVFYPGPPSGLHLQAGAGYQTHRAEFCVISCAQNPRETATQSGAGFLVGVGYDLRLARALSLTPHANLLFTVGGSGRIIDIALPDANTNVLQVGLAATFH